MIDAEQAVTRPSEFFGQRHLVRRIYSRIAAERPQSVALIGGRKVGKTSLLSYIAHPDVQKEYLPEGARCTLIPVRCEQDSELTVETFIGRLARMVSEQEPASGEGYPALQRAVEEAHQAGRSLVCILDDFHFITRSPNFPLEFFSFLRSLANNFNLAYVTSSFLELQKLCVAKDIEESPFFNIFTNVSLGLLGRADAEALLAGLTGWDGTTVSAVVGWAGPHPYLLKLIAREAGTEPPPPGAFAALFLPLFKEYFSLILALLPRDAWKPLKELGKGKQVDMRDVHYLKPLIRHRFLTEEEEAIGFFSEAFAAFVRDQASPDLLKGEDFVNHE